jgi:hypothetical protein
LIDPTTGLNGCFISAADLMAAKLAAGRPAGYRRFGRAPQSRRRPTTEA